MPGMAASLLRRRGLRRLYVAHALRGAPFYCVLLLFRDVWVVLRFTLNGGCLLAARADRDEMGQD